MPPWDATHTGARVAGEAGDKDVEEFAALLRRLKARTDRSYSQLARRLNMNASTLHRYCVGEAVPLDFASVERFAALCGATPEERLELHRYWILAVAARQRRRDAQPPVESPVPHPAPVPVPVPVPAPDAAPEPTARSPWYRRRLTLTAAAVCAVLAVLGSLAAVSRGGSPRTRTVAGTHSGTATGDRAGATPKPTPALPAPSPGPPTPRSGRSAATTTTSSTRHPRTCRRPRSSRTPGSGRRPSTRRTAGRRTWRSRCRAGARRPWS